MSRGYAWLDETVEHSEQDEARAAALARRWSILHDAEEQRMFRKQNAFDEGYCDYGPELDHCEVCGGDMKLGLDGPRTRRGEIILKDWQVGIDCPNPNCVDGLDETPLKEAEQAERERRANYDLEIEVIEEMLNRIGARMMRSYEHWNEDEHLIAYLEGEVSW